MGYLVLAALSLLAFVAAVAVSLRAEPKGRAELALSTAMLWNFFVVVPIYALGFTNLLTPKILGVVAFVFFSAVLAACFVQRDPRLFLRQIRDACVGLLRLPFDGIALAGKQRSFVVVGLVFTLVVLVWTTWISWLAPSWGQWDALWYHEPIIGFTIQNHGFAVVDLPMDAQKINGYPRLVEMTQLWFVVFTDRRLIEVSNSILAAPALVLATYVLVRRYTEDKVVAMGWGVSVLLMPATSNLLQTIYVDILSAAYIVAATFYCTRPRTRLSDGWLASVCLALAIGSKYLALVPVGVLAPIAAWRLVAEHRKNKLGIALAIVGGGVVVIGAAAAATYLHNYVKFHNPLWPDLKVDIPKWNIHWPGNVEWGADKYNEDPRKRVSMNIPFDTFLQDLYRVPWTVDRSWYGQTYDYGFVTAYLLVPFTLVALGLGALSAMGSILARLFDLPQLRARPETLNMLLVSVPMIAILWTSPALWSARYNLAAVAIAMVCVAWLGTRARAWRLSEGTVVASTFGMIVMFFWAQPRWWLTPKEAQKLAKISYPEREVTQASTLDPSLYHARGSAILRDVGLAREAEIGAGDVVAVDDNYGGFIALFWNNRFSNKVVFLPTASFLEDADRVHAKWVYCNFSDPNLRALRAADSGWQEIGTLNDEGWGAMFRRVH